MPYMLRLDPFLATRRLQQVILTRRILSVARIELDNVLDGVIVVDVQVHRSVRDEPSDALIARRRRQRAVVLVKRRVSDEVRSRAQVERTRATRAAGRLDLADGVDDAVHDRVKGLEEAAQQSGFDKLGEDADD